MHAVDDSLFYTERLPIQHGLLGQLALRSLCTAAQPARRNAAAEAVLTTQRSWVCSRACSCCAHIHAHLISFVILLKLPCLACRKGFGCEYVSKAALF